MSSSSKSLQIFEFIAAVLLICIVSVASWFGYAFLREEAQDLCHMSGGSLEFYPDMRLFGLALVGMVVVAFLLAKAINRSVGTVLTIILIITAVFTFLIPVLTP